jgi:hypothetical protein
MAETTLTAPPTGETTAAAETTPTPEPERVVIDKGADDWRATLPDDLKADPFLGRYKSQEEALRGVAAAQKTISAGLLKRPGADAKPEEIARYRESIGVPKDIAGYEINAAEYGLDADALEAFKPILLKHGIPADAAKGLIADFAAREVARLDQVQQGWVGEIAEWKAQVGIAKFNRASTAAFRFAEQMAEDSGLGWDTVRGFLDSSRLGDHPILFRLMATAGERMLEDGIIHGDDPINAPDILAAKIKAIRDDPKHPFNVEGHPGHKKAVDEVLALTQQMLGKEGKRVVSVI